MSDPKNLPALKRLLTEARDQAPEAMGEALAILQSAHTVHAGVNLQLQAALASIRAGRPEDATRYIEIALGIQARWALN